MSKIFQVLAITVVAAFGLAGSTGTAQAFELTVTYSNLTGSGPISFGILPEDFEKIDLTFDVKGIGTSPGIFDAGDVVSASITLGDLTLSVDDLADFDLVIGTVNAEVIPTVLNYSFNPVDTPTATMVVISNNSFQLSITGHDEGSGEDFDYFWQDSTDVVDSSLPNINIKPGSDPNSINTCSGGTTPVALFGSDTLDVEMVDQDQMILASALVRTVGKADRNLCSIADIGAPGPSSVFFDGLDDFPDGNLDLVCHFVTLSLMEDASSTMELQVVGCDDPAAGCSSGDPGYFEASGRDSVNIVKDCN